MTINIIIYNIRGLKSKHLLNNNYYHFHIIILKINRLTKSIVFHLPLQNLFM